jgi:membrane protease YdiL (CAAX protease family)
MTTCLLHPDAEAPARCEFCDQPHCGTCLRLLLGRRYCPSCYQQVQALTLGQAQRAQPLPANGSRPAAAAPAVSARPVPRLPGWLSAAIYLLLFLVIYGAAQHALVVVISGAKAGIGGSEAALTNPLAPGPLPLAVWSFLWIVGGWAALMVVLALTAVLSHLVEKRTLADLGLRWRATAWRDLFVGFGMAAALFISVAGIAAGKGWYDIRSLASAPQALAITVTGLLILLPFAAVEEISMRGYVLQAVSRSWGPAAGVAVSTLVFAAVHSQNEGFRQHPLAWVGLLLAGLYLASAYQITGNLWLAIFLHTGWNLLQGPIFGLPVSGNSVPASVFRMQSTGPDLWTGGSFGPEAGLLLCGLMVVHLVTLWAMRPVLQPPRGAGAARRGAARGAGDAHLPRAIPVE